MKGVKLFAAALIAAFGIAASSPAWAYDGSLPDDTMYIGDVTKVDAKSKTMEIKTRFEKTPKTFNISLQPECYVHTAKRGEFSKFADLKAGTLVSVYGWQKDGKWMARRIATWDPNDYLIKRLEEDAKAGVYFKSENVE
ncbi:MAG: hypothetical protein HZA01_07070 [Nitrospinae bacterium]|nr:hypothetical protein [Nitrospinota bacterium]